MPGPDVVAGRFALCDPLARGATGTVWRAWDLRRHEWCAAKLMRQRDAGDPLRFAREQGVRLEHPHLLTPYSWAAEDAHVVIVSPLVGGGSLHTLLGDHGPLSEPLVADLLDQLLDGLAHAHAAGLVHRDVTPANVLLEATGSGRPVLRLADFGLAVRVGEPRLTRLGTVLGTAGYVPPEVLAGAAPHPSADLYAAGQVALTLLTGTEPDTDGTRPTAAGGAPDAGLGTGPLRRLVAALVAPDPADRPASATAARQALPARPVTTPTTATGDPVTVLTQLPDLPPNWTPAGPAGPVPPAGDPAGIPATSLPSDISVRATARLDALLASEPTRPVTSPRPAVLGSTGPHPAAPPDPRPTGPPGPDRRPTGPPATNNPRPAGAPALTDPRPTGAPARGPQGPVTVSSGPAGGRVPPPHRERGKRRWRRPAAAGAGVAAVVVAGVVALQGRGPDGEPGGGPSVSPSGSAVVSGPAVAGGVCGWQQEGDGATDAGGRALLCVRTDGGFRWQVS